MLHSRVFLFTKRYVYGAKDTFIALKTPTQAIPKRVQYAVTSTFPHYKRKLCCCFASNLKHNGCLSQLHCCGEVTATGADKSCALIPKHLTFDIHQQAEHLLQISPPKSQLSCKRSGSKYTRFTVPHIIQSSAVQLSPCSVLGEKSYAVIYNTGMRSAVKAHRYWVYYTILVQCAHSMYPYYQCGLVVHYTCTLTDSWCDTCVYVCDWCDTRYV